MIGSAKLLYSYLGLVKLLNSSQFPTLQPETQYYFEIIEILSEVIVKLYTIPYVVHLKSEG